MDGNSDVAEELFSRVMHLNPDPDAVNESDGAVDDAYTEEYESVNSALDEISAFMDALEEQNDSLFSKLQQLLEDSRQARLKPTFDTGEMQQSTDVADSGTGHQADEASQPPS
jgi:uncharacterized protein YoxC